MIDKKIKKLGDKFRGLWQIRGVNRKIHKQINIQWYVTFRFNGDYLETESQDTIEEALDYAINFLGLKINE